MYEQCKNPDNTLSYMDSMRLTNNREHNWTKDHQETSD
jgi:hypothetical protein